MFIVSALFFAQNDGLVEINYFSGMLNWQLNWVMLACLLVGFFLGVLSIVGSLLQTKLQLRQSRSRLKKLEQEINNLRALPIKENY